MVGREQGEKVRGGAVEQTADASGPARDARSPLYYETEIPVRIYDTDMLGVVNNVVYVRWLEDLRTGWCDCYLPLAEQMAQGFAPVIVSIHIEYGTPVRFGNQVIGKVWVTPERVRMVVDTEICSNGSLAARARQVVAMVRTDTLRPTRMPASLLHRYEETAAIGGTERRAPAGR